MFRIALSAALAAAIPLGATALAQDVTLTMSELEFDDFFKSCYPQFAAEISPEGSVDEVELKSVTVFATAGSIFRRAAELGTRTCTYTVNPGGGGGFSCSSSGDVKQSCEQVTSVTVSDFLCDGAACGSVTVTETGLLSAE